MPQGYWLDPVMVLVILIKDLVVTETVDDITLTETLKTKEEITLNLSLDYVISWSTDNLMSINQKKIKEMKFHGFH